MAIHRGVSLYSYQQAQFFGKMNWKDMVREVHDNLHTDGIEIINESTIPHYPFPSDEFIYDWNNYLARYNMKAVTKDVYLDTMRFRDHVMTHREAAELLKMDIQIAARMGFQNVRCLIAVPLDVMQMAEDTAVKYNVRIGREIHAPAPILPEPNNPRHGRSAWEVVEYVQKSGSTHIGLVPDFGIFQHHSPRVSVQHTIRNADPEERAFCEAHVDLGYEGLLEAFNEKFPTLAAFGNPLPRAFFPEQKQPAQAEDLRQIIPYIFSIHGKFYEMTEIPGEPGHYEDAAVDYANPIRILNECGFDGYIDSEYEGQRSQQDMGIEGLPDDVKEVRRHHEMLARLSGEGENIVSNLY